MRRFLKPSTHLQVMARDNAQVQNRIFERIDLLLEVQGTHSELAVMLTEVCRYLLLFMLCIQS